MNNFDSQLDDNELFARISTGDEDALRVLYDRYNLQILRFLIHQTQDQQAAEELLQDVFLAAWNRAFSFRGMSTVKTWLLRVAYYRAATWVSKRKPLVGIEDIEKMPGRDPGLEEQIDANWNSEQVKNVLEDLTPNHRVALELIYFHQLTYKEAAQVVGCPVGTMKSRVSYALSKANGLLTKSGFDK